MDGVQSVAGASLLSAADGLAELDRQLGAGTRRVRLKARVGALKALAVARLAQATPAAERPLVVVTPDDAAAAALARDIEFFLASAPPSDQPEAPRPVIHLPHLETTPWADLSPDRRAIVQRMSTLFRLSQGLPGMVLVGSAAGLARKVIPPAAYAGLVDVVEAEQEINRDATLALLTRGGYQRAQVVEDPGTFAVRGGVIDIFIPLYRFPVRIELLGDVVETLRFFDPLTQRSLRAVPEVFLHPVRETVLTAGNRLRERLLHAGDLAAHPSSKTRAVLDQIDKGEDFFGVEALTPAFHAQLAPLFDYLGATPRLFVDDVEACMQALASELADAEEAYAERLASHRLAFPPADFFMSVDELRAAFERGRVVESVTLDVQPEAAAQNPMIEIQVDDHRALELELRRARAEKHEQLLQPLVSRLRDWRDEGIRALLVALNLQHAERLESLLKGYQIAPLLHREPGVLDVLDPRAPRDRVEIALGSLARGLYLPLDRVAVVTESEIFGEKAVRQAPRRARGAFRPDDFKNVEAGAFVVHSLHGIGIYKGLTKLPVSRKDGAAVDFLHLEYEGGALYLPVWRLNEVKPYSGADGVSPKLDRLGGVTWEKKRAKVRKDVGQLAEELLQLYAQRKSLPGHSFALPHGTEELFREFEATFPFEETADQQRAIDEVLTDMDETRPMDRLVCGDVGYGKTEVALRAALKSVLAGRQVAVLAPTTVLVEQHTLSFQTRFRDLPVRVEALSRFRSRAEQTAIVKGIAEGQVDVVVGTHRLLSSDLRWKQLGLLIIDEEQRFGVAHKERIKRLKTQIDVLTMTATPIPRTLHMALMGLREISVITTPPADRLAIRTVVARHSDALVAEGVRRELARGGQVFFVHNRVEDIGLWETRLRKLLPDVRLVVGHGQMPPEQLERVMIDFVDGKADLLLCTTIIESGLDIPRANTMFVNRADRFGLAQLYQLRGRIGRARERAYCYLLIPPEDALTSEAKSRLAVLQRFSELGAGFQIASHDLEIRGAGDLLGAKQSGDIAAVGFETYTALLEEAVATLKGEPIHEERDPELTCELPAYIPSEYCPDVGQRLEFYRRLSSAADEQEVRALVAELSDRFGAPPPEVAVLADIMIVKSLGRRLRARAIELGESRLALALADDTPLQPARVAELVQRKGSPWKLTPDMRLVHAFGEAEKAERPELAKRLLLDLLAN